MSLIISILPERLRPYAKSLVAVLGVVLSVGASLAPFLPESAQAVFASAVAVLAALGVYAVPNTTTDEPAGDEFSDDTSDDA